MKKLYSVVELAFCLLACGCTNLHEEILNEQDNSQVITDHGPEQREDAGSASLCLHA